jgi:hypothetical protein
MVLINCRPSVSYHERRSQVRFFCNYSVTLTTAPDSTFTGRTAKHSTWAAHSLTILRFSKRPTALSAPAYVEALMTWTQAKLDDERIFPQKIGVRFPPDFLQICGTILRRLFRVYAHIYHSHFDQICALGIEGMLASRYHEVNVWYSPLEHQLPSFPPIR